MGDSVVSVKDAFSLCDELLADGRIELSAEPDDLERLMRTVSKPFARQAATRSLSNGFRSFCRSHNGHLRQGNGAHPSASTIPCVAALLSGSPTARVPAFGYRSLQRSRLICTANRQRF